MPRFFTSFKNDRQVFNTVEKQNPPLPGFLPLPLVGYGVSLTFTVSLRSSKSDSLASRIRGQLAGCILFPLIDNENGGNFIFFILLLFIINKRAYYQWIFGRNIFSVKNPVFL